MSLLNLISRQNVEQPQYITPDYIYLVADGDSISLKSEFPVTIHYTLWKGPVGTGQKIVDEDRTILSGGITFTLRENEPPDYEGDWNISILPVAGQIYGPITKGTLIIMSTPISAPFTLKNQAGEEILHSTTRWWGTLDEGNYFIVFENVQGYEPKTGYTTLYIRANEIREVTETYRVSAPIKKKVAEIHIQYIPFPWVSIESAKVGCVNIANEKLLEQFPDGTHIAENPRIVYAGLTNTITLDVYETTQPFNIAVTTALLIASLILGTAMVSFGILYSVSIKPMAEALQVVAKDVRDVVIEVEQAKIDGLIDDQFADRIITKLNESADEAEQAGEDPFLDWIKHFEGWMAIITPYFKYIPYVVLGIVGLIALPAIISIVSGVGRAVGKVGNVLSREESYRYR